MIIEETVWSGRQQNPMEARLQSWRGIAPEIVPSNAGFIQEIKIPGVE